MKLFTGLVLGGCSLVASGLAAEPLRVLSAAEMDAVAAGDAGVIAVAAGAGAVVLTNARTAAHALRDPGSRSDRSDMGSTVYAAGGNAAAYGSDTSDTGVAARTSSSAPGASTVSQHWRVDVLNVSISSGYSFTAADDRPPVVR